MAEKKKYPIRIGETTEKNLQIIRDKGHNPAELIRGFIALMARELLPKEDK